jgi:hypothetical protein
MLDNMEKLALSEIILSNKQAQEQGHLESDTTKHCLHWETDEAFALAPLISGSSYFWDGLAVSKQTRQHIHNLFLDGYVDSNLFPNQIPPRTNASTLLHLDPPGQLARINNPGNVGPFTL